MPTVIPIADPSDDKARRRIAESLDESLLVEAAAGTGKTTELIGRIVAVLRTGRALADRLVAVTFTRKAAGELKLRLRQTLDEAFIEARSQQPDSAEVARLEQAIKDLEKAHIGTIHSFCARLLRERPVEAGVDLSFQELEEEADLRLRQQAWDEHLAGLLGNDDPILKELDELGLEITSLSSAFQEFANYPDVQAWPVSPVELPNLGPARKELQNYAGHMEELSHTWEDRSHDMLMDIYEHIVRMVRQADLTRPRELMEILEEFRSEAKVVQKYWPAGPGQAKAEQECWNSFADRTARPLVRLWYERRYERVLRVLQLALAVYDRLRQRAGALNYQDLLLRAAALLQNKREIREYFRARFTHLLVDEFQDTDPIQAEVMLLLTADDPNQTDWRQCRPVPGSLFVVGDPKQSIYRFRRADIVTYNQVKNIIESCGTVVSLSANFRTIPPLIDWINQAFDAVFPEASDLYSPAQCPLLVGRTEGNDGQLTGIRTLRVPAALTTGDAAVEHEAILVARAIRHWWDHGLTVPRTPKQLADGNTPEVKPGDFLIIARQKKHLACYARKLDELGIPNQETGGNSLQELEELRLLHTCLSALTQPDNPVALVAALRSELFGISDTALYAFKRAGGRFSFHGPLPAALRPEDVQVFEDAFGRLRRYASWLRQLPPRSALERIVADLGLPARAATAAGGNVRAGSLAKALEVLRAAQVDFHSAADLTDYLKQFIEKGKEVEGAPAREPDQSVVRIMNLHKAKGLEAPIVFLVDPSGDREHVATLHIDRSAERTRGYLAVDGDSSGHSRPRLAQPLGWDRFEKEEGRFLAAEEKRLRYVAATRAGSLLVITQKEKRNDLNPWQFFDKDLNCCPILEDPGPQVPPGSEPAQVSIAALTQANLAIAERWATILRPTYAVQAAKKVAVTETLQRQAAARPTITAGPAGEHGTEWGSVIHLLLETAAREPATDLHKLAHDALAEQDELLTYLADGAVATVEKVKRSGIWQRALASKRRLVEVPFQVLLPADDPRTQPVPTVLRGVIDLVFLEPRGWVIVDYKTDACALEEVDALVEHHRAQVLLYADTWQKIVGETVQEVGLYFTSVDRYVALSYP